MRVRARALQDALHPPPFHPTPSLVSRTHVPPPHPPRADAQPPAVRPAQSAPRPPRLPAAGAEVAHGPCCGRSTRSSRSQRCAMRSASDALAVGVRSRGAPRTATARRGPRSSPTPSATGARSPPPPRRAGAPAAVRQQPQACTTPLAKRRSPARARSARSSELPRPRGCPPRPLGSSASARPARGRRVQPASGAGPSRRPRRLDRPRSARARRRRARSRTRRPASRDSSTGRPGEADLLHHADRGRVVVERVRVDAPVAEHLEGVRDERKRALGRVAEAPGVPAQAVAELDLALAIGSALELEEADEGVADTLAARRSLPATRAAPTRTCAARCDRRAG